MAWQLEEALCYYQKQGAPSDQSALIGLLRELQQEHGGGIPRHLLMQAAEGLGTKESYLLAVIKRIPSLRLSEEHCLELCAGPNCSKRASLAAFAEKNKAASPEKLTIRYVPCMRMCGKGPNLRWDGTLYNQADEALLKKLMKL